MKCRLASRGFEACPDADRPDCGCNYLSRGNWWELPLAAVFALVLLAGIVGYL